MSSEDPAKRPQAREPHAMGRQSNERDPLIEESLDLVLGEQVVPSARPEFRAELRRRFLGLASSSSAPGEGSGSAFGEGVWANSEESGESVTRERMNTNSESEMGIDHLLQFWQPEAPCVSFKDALRGQFLSGDFSDEGLRPLQDQSSAGHLGEHTARLDSDCDFDQALTSRPRSLKATHSARSGGSRRPASGRAPSSARFDRRRVWGGVLGLAAALMVVPLLLRGSSDTQGWRVLSSDSGQTVAFQVDGAPYSSAEGLAAAEIVTSGSKVLRLELPDQMILELDPDSSIDLSGVGGDEDWTLAMAGISGGYRVATLPGFKQQSRRLFFTTPDAQVEVVETVFGVDRYENDPVNPNGTCVCCVDGVVSVEAQNSEGVCRTVAGKSTFVKNEGKVSPMGLHAKHRIPLEALAREFH